MNKKKRIKELEERVEQLEQRIEILEARPHMWYEFPPQPYNPYGPHDPWILPERGYLWEELGSIWSWFDTISPVYTADGTIVKMIKK